MLGIDLTSEPDLEELRQSYALIERDSDQALAKLERLTNKGSVMSMCYLAEIYQSGEYVSADIEKAKHWWARAEENGVIHASYMLGRIYILSRQYDSAIREFSKGIESFYCPSIYALANIYEKGLGVTKNLSEARRFLELGVKRNHLLSKRNLAAMYMKGSLGILFIPYGFFLFISVAVDFFVYIFYIMVGKSSKTTVAFPFEMSKEI